MRYFGGKARTNKHIAKIINKSIINYKFKNFISPFVGGAWVESLIECDNKYLLDKHNYLIDMYIAIQKGWKPPQSLSKEDYDYVKNNKDDKPYLTGFVGFGCSFAGKWFGGYAKSDDNRNYCLNAHNSVLSKMEKLNNAIFLCKDYKDLKPKESVVYCDPPYQGTTQYDRNIIGEFNTEEFWNVVRNWSKNNLVFISEYNAPSDFVEVWRKEVKLDIRDSNNKKKERIEKLFIHKSNYEKYKIS